MSRKLTIALVAHDQRKADMVDWVEFNSDFLANHRLVCTGTTGTLVRQALNKQHVDADIECMNSGPMGGDAQIAALVATKKVDLAVFLIDDLNPQPHEADIMMLLRQCRIHNVPIACNRYSADLMITSTLWEDSTYQPMQPHYETFDREAFEKRMNE